MTSGIHSCKDRAMSINVGPILQKSKTRSSGKAEKKRQALCGFTVPFWRAIIHVTGMLGTEV